MPKVPLLYSAVTLVAVILGLSITTYAQAQSQSETSEMRTETTVVDTGFSVFADQPTAYRFMCGEAPGKVTDLKIERGMVVISYWYPAAEGRRYGELIGAVSERGVFAGTYDTHTKSGRLKGPIQLSFADDGQAFGMYGNDAGRTAIYFENAK